MKASNLPVSKVRQFLHSKLSYAKITLATRKLKKMMAFARFKNENWCMDLAYVDQVAKEIKDLKYLLIRQDVFDRTVDAKGMKTKDSKETVRAFLTVITNDIDLRKFGSRKEQKLLESLKNYAKHRAYIFIPHWVRPRLHLLNVQYDPWKSYFTVTWKIMDTSSFKNCFNSLQHWLLEGIAR